MTNRILQLFEIQYPIVQAGMVWCSGWQLAAAVSNAGALGLIGAGSMTPDLLREHVQKCRAATSKPFGVNIPLLYGHADACIQVVVEEQVPIVFSSAGNPAKWTSHLKENGIKVAHVVANTRFAKKAEAAGVDAIVAEGFEAGGHNGAEETTTMTLIPVIRQTVSIPLIAAGGIASGRSMLAALALGADGVQIGTRFVASHESSAHPSFKQRIVESNDGDTVLALKKVVPVRMMKNRFFDQVRDAESRGASAEELRELLGRGRSRRGMFEGDLDEGELEIGQASALIREVKPAGIIVQDIMQEFESARREISAAQVEAE